MTDSRDYPATEQGEELAALREMTSAMLDAAEHSRWAEVQRLDEARTKLLQGVPAATLSCGGADVRAILDDALEATASIARRLAEARDEIGRQLKQHNQRQQAVVAYRTAG